jgi:hypothetical protein
MAAKKSKTSQFLNFPEKLIFYTMTFKKVRWKGLDHLGVSTWGENSQLTLKLKIFFIISVEIFSLIFILLAAVRHAINPS